MLGTELLIFFYSGLFFENFLFQVNSVPVSRNEEANTPAWQFSEKHVSIISADVDSTLVSQSKPIIILDELFDLSNICILTCVTLYLFFVSLFCFQAK